MPRRARAKAGDPASALPPIRVLAIAAIAGLALAAASAAFSLALVSESSNPYLAVRLVPWLPKAQARIGDLIFATSKGKPTSTQARAMRERARNALAATPLNSSALRQLAVTGPRRKELLDLAIAVSRRDVLADIQRSEFDIRRNDADATLAGLDRALRVSPQVAPLVFPVLLGATDNPVLLGKIRAMLSRGPIWSERLVAWAGENPAVLGRLSRVVGALPKGSVARAPGYGQSIVAKLADQRQPAQAFAAYAAYSPPPRFADLDRTTFPPIDWQLTDDYETGGRPIADGRPGFDLFAERGKAGPAAARLLALGPGRYRLSLRQADIEGRGGELRIGLSCLVDQRERALATTALPIAAGTREASFAVPAGCPYQWLRIAIAAGDEPARTVIRAAGLERQGAAPTAAR